MVIHSSGVAVPVRPGATVLETLREHGIPHASVCGGRARCTTCRILVTRGLDSLPAPGGLEKAALARIGAAPAVRLACQVCPTSDIAVLPLLSADAAMVHATGIRGLEGSERPVTVMFVDLRGFTAIGESKLPYDVLFMLDQFFREMIGALSATNGYYSQFTGDGLMALYGLNGDDPKVGAADAVRGAREMLERLGRLNERLKADLPEPLRIGIGIHFAEAIVGAMGPPGSRIITAIGDSVNITARLESLTKEFGCAIVISRDAAEAGGLDLPAESLHEIMVRGRTQPVQVYAIAGS
jgi:adenylate cyclase